MKVIHSLPPAEGWIPSCSSLLEKQSMLLKPSPEPIPLMDIGVSYNITVTIVVIVQVKQDSFKFNLELNWGGEMTEGTLRSSLQPATLVPHSTDVWLSWIPQCEMALYKFKSFFFLGTELHWFSHSMFIHWKICSKVLPLLFTYWSSNMGVGPGSWVKSQDKFYVRDMHDKHPFRCSHKWMWEHWRKGALGRHITHGSLWASGRLWELMLA